MQLVLLMLIAFPAQGRAGIFPVPIPVRPLGHSPRSSGTVALTPLPKTVPGEDQWQLTWDVKTLGGKRRQRYLTVCGNKRDAQKKLREILGALDTGNYVDPSKRKTGEYLTTWLAKRKNQLSLTTYDAYRSNIEGHLVPALGEIRLQQLTWETLEEYIVERSEYLCAARHCPITCG